MNYSGSYLRVLTPRTTNGTNLQIDANDKVVMREDHLPLSAKKYLESQNKSLPKHLRKKIEVVEAYVEPAKSIAEADELKEKLSSATSEIDALKAQLASMQTELAKNELINKLSNEKQVSQTKPAAPAAPTASTNANKAN